MSLSSHMNKGTKMTETNDVGFAKSARAARLQKRIDFWSSVKGIGNGFKNFDESTQMNLAAELDNQAGHMAHLTETQIASSFNNFTPENMLRLVRLAMPNVIRSKIFTEFAMETARDSIKYVRPVYSKTQNGKELSDKTDDFARIYKDVDDGYNDINDENARRAIYESTDDRINQALANVASEEVKESSTVVGATFKFQAATDATIASAKASITDDATKLAYDMAVASKKWGENGEKYVDGYGVIYYENETLPIAQQDKRTKKWLIAQEFAGITITQAVSSGVTSITIGGTLTDATAFKALVKDSNATFDFGKVKCFARYDDETDFNGDFLGEIEIKMSDYEFRPRATSIGVTWSQLSEIQLDTSFSLSAEEYLITYAAATIKQELDYRAIRIGYLAAKTNPKGYLVEFDAAYSTVGVGSNAGTKDSYKDNAQTFISAVSTVGDNMYNDIKRGGVSRLVAGPSAGTYCQLMMQYSNKGAMTAEGAYQIGELDGKPLFKVPNSIIPTNEILTVWKNPNNDADIAIAFGTLVPFFSTGVIQRKNFYKEAGLATYGDWSIINRRYLAIIRINNLKDLTVN